ncbi:MAG: hypothetical protein ACLSAF_15535 [Intestinimonas sp.]
MDKIERLRVSRTEETENKRAQAMQIAVQAYPALRPLWRPRPFSVSISGVVLFYIDPAGMWKSPDRRFRAPPPRLRLRSPHPGREQERSPHRGDF